MDYLLPVQTTDQQRLEHRLLWGERSRRHLRHRHMGTCPLSPSSREAWGGWEPWEAWEEWGSNKVVLSITSISISLWELEGG